MPPNHPGRVPSPAWIHTPVAVPKLCQNPITLCHLEFLFEREQLPQVVDIRHIRIESMERLEPANILRNEQVAGSIPVGGSMFSITCRHLPFQNSDTGLTQQSFSARPVPKPRFGKTASK